MLLSTDIPHIYFNKFYIDQGEISAEYAHTHTHTADLKFQLLSNPINQRHQPVNNPSPTDNNNQPQPQPQSQLQREYAVKTRKNSAKKERKKPDMRPASAGIMLVSLVAWAAAFTCGNRGGTAVCCTTREQSQPLAFSICRFYFPPLSLLVSQFWSGFGLGVVIYEA
jgi:hypothetical protein